MGWFTDRNKDAELLKKLQERYGKDKSQDDILAELEAASAAKEAAEKAATEAKAALDAKTAVDNELTQARQRLAELEANNRPEPRETQPGRPPSVLIDEDAAFNARLSPLIAAQFQQAAMLAKQLAQQQLAGDPKTAKLFKRYRDEVDSYFARVPMQQQVHSESYINCYRIVVGGHLDEIATEAAKGGGALFSETGGGAAPASPEPQNDKLSPEELKVAARMRVTPEAYLKRKKEMQFLGL